MRKIEYRSWKGFRGFLSEYSSQGREQRGRFLFRGQGRADWPLEPTLDRGREFADCGTREDYYQALLVEFRREAVRIVNSPDELPEGRAFELLARHHGVPSPILDWTESPFIASFFALESSIAVRPKSGRVALWVFERQRFDFDSGSIDLIDDLELLRFNRRALQQRGVFVNVRSFPPPLADQLNNALTKLVIRVDNHLNVLAELDEMGINAASLFHDLDGAARTAIARLITG